MKKLFIYILTAVFAFRLTSEIPVFANEADEPMLPKASAYILAETETGEILTGYNYTERLPLSSLAKLMTLLIIADALDAGRINPDDSVPTSADASSAGGSVIWLNPGEIMTLSELVKSVIIASSNDATIALAEYAAGSTNEFTARMNARADRLGMYDTYFADPTGISAENYSTARDIAVMSAELFKCERFMNEFGYFFLTRLDAVRTGTERETQLVNTNKLAHWYKGLLGGKAGHSPDAGFCLANTAKRGDMRLVAVILGAGNEDDRVNLCETLLDTGFNDYEFVTPELDTAQFSPVKVERGVSKTVEAASAKTVSFIAAKGSGNTAKYEYQMSESVTAPVEAGQLLGTLTIHVGDKTVGKHDIVAVYAVEELTFPKSMSILLSRFFRF